MGAKFELFHVKYRLPVFGSEGKEFHPELKGFTVSTRGGKADAEEACKKYHPGCKVVAVLTRLEEAAGVDPEAIEAAAKQAKAKKK